MAGYNTVCEPALVWPQRDPRAARRAGSDGALRGWVSEQLTRARLDVRAPDPLEHVARLRIRVREAQLQRPRQALHLKRLRADVYVRRLEYQVRLIAASAALRGKAIDRSSPP